MKEYETSNHHKFIYAIVLAGISYFSAAFAVRFLIQPQGMAPFWFQNGTALAFLLRTSRKNWPLLFAAVYVGFSANLVQTNLTLYPHLIYGLVNIFEPLMAALLIQRFMKPFDLENLRAVGILILSTFISCVVGASMAWLVGPVSWPLWWIDDWLGYLLVAPAILIFWKSADLYPRFTRPSLRSLIEMLGILAGMALTLDFLFTKSHHSTQLFYSYSVLPFLLWATLRFKDKGVAIASLQMGLMTIGFTIYGIGPFAGADALLVDRSLSVQIFLAVVMLSHLSLALSLSDRERIDSIQRQQIKILENIGHGSNLKEILEQIVYFVENQERGLLCSILLLDEKKERVCHGAAPHLPKEFNREIDGAKIGPTEGSCGAAAATGRAIFVEDIETHPNWTNYKQLALPHGLRSCWSSPILSPQNEVLGTFAMYYKTCRLPSSREIEWVGVATYLAAVAILGDRHELFIKRSEARMRQLFETTLEGIWMIDGLGCTTYINPRLAHLLGHPQEEILGKSLSSFVFEDDQTMVNQRLSRRFRGMSEQYEVRLMHKNGSIKWVIIAGSPIVDRKGAVEGALEMVTDITEKKSLELQIIHAQRMESLPNDHRLQDKISNILAAGKRASTLVSQILTFSRPQPPKRTVVNLQTVVEDAVRLLRSTLPTMINIQTHFVIDTPSAFADASQIHQIVMNLGTNAAQVVLPGGSIDFRVDIVNLREKSFADTAGFHPGRYVRLRVGNNGPGMSPQVLAKVFEPFFTTRASKGGTGLGLSVVRGIVKNHGGAIRVTSSPKKGTIFSVYIPFAEMAEAAPKKIKNKSFRGNSERVLYIDDEELVTKIVTSLLTDLGYVVSSFTEPKKVMDLIKENQLRDFDVFITDYEMPELTGLDLMKELRASRPDIPIILVTGFLAPSLADEVQKIGVRGSLTKPDFINELPKVLSDLFGH